MLNIIRQIPIKTTVRYHNTPTKMAAIKRIDINNCRQGCKETRTLLVDVKLYTPLRKEFGGFRKC